MTKDKRLIITIDGPAGAGKSTVGQAVAKRLSYSYLDTGAIYRAVAYKILQDGMEPDDETSIHYLLKQIKIEMKFIDGNMKVFINGTNVSEPIRTEEIGFMASKISALASVRDALLDIQRNAGEIGGIVAEGRDMGTVVFPDAEIKFFLDASIEERSRRRYRELADKGVDADIRTIEKDIMIRDKQDRERLIAPLKVPEDSVIIDSSNMNIIDVVENMMSYITKKIMGLKTL